MNNEAANIMKAERITTKSAAFRIVPANTPYYLLVSQSRQIFKIKRSFVINDLVTEIKQCGINLTKL